MNDDDEAGERKARSHRAMATQRAITTPGRTRLRRLRRTRELRNLVAETRVTAEQLIMPHFVLPEKRANQPISSMPGIAQQGVETVVETIGKTSSSASARCSCSAIPSTAARRRTAARPRPRTARCNARASV